MKAAVYNARKPHMSIRRFVLAALLSLSLVLLAEANSCASIWSAPEKELASKVEAVTGPGAVSLLVRNRSSLAQADVNSIHAELRAQFEGAGMQLVTAEQAAASVEVTLSENIQSYLWVAQIQQGNNSPAVVMVLVARAGPAIIVPEAAPLAIAKIELWSQENRIIDVGIIDSPPRIIVLEAERVALYSRLNNGRWQPDGEFAIRHVRPWPRDLRGRLVLRKDYLFDAYLPGIICAANLKGSRYLKCSQSDDPWPLAGEGFRLNGFFSSTRNFFTGALTPNLGSETTLPAFYSAAPIPRQKYVLWLFAAIDGQVYASDGMSNMPVSAPGWGSGIAAVRSSCGSGWQVLATSNSDGNRPDSVRAYQLSDRDPVAVGEGVAMGGPVTSLWTEAAGNTAVAITRNLRTGQYEAFRLAISCGQ
ncbi:MAG: hypothetical protein JO249_08910 [Acidobacteria bacterium]|nr:hypothetical protein [Acidobacteriota bacterium]